MLTVPLLQVWEAIVTLLYFPVCVVLAWIADRRLLFYKYMHKRYRADKRHGIVVEMEGDLEPKGIDMIMDGKLSDGASCAGNSSSVSVQTGNELDQNKDEVRHVGETLLETHIARLESKWCKIIDVVSFNFMMCFCIGNRYKK